MGRKGPQAGAARGSRSGRAGRRRRRWAPRSAAAAILVAVLLAAVALDAGSPAADPLSEPAAELTAGGEASFGTSVAMSADGRTAIVGAPRANGLLGTAWVFVRTGSGWSEQAQLVGGEQSEEAEGCPSGGEEEECLFGTSVALSADGSTAAIGAPRAGGPGPVGSAWIFSRSGSTWTQQGPKLSGSGHFGRSVALSGDGSTALIGAPSEGAALIFTREGSGWTQAAKLTGPIHFGRSVALTSDGLLALIGAPGAGGGAGKVLTYVRLGGSWEAQYATLSGDTAFGRSVAVSADGSTALVGDPSGGEAAGSVVPFAREGFNWVALGSPMAPPPEASAGGFAHSIALSADGTHALVGGVGTAWMFTRSEGGFTQPPTTIADPEPGPAGRFGSSVSLSADGSSLLVGAPRDLGSVGAAWAFPGTGVPRPTVTTISPSSGSDAGGTIVTIKGSAFHPGAGVTIGNAATNVHVLSETELVAETSATTAGSYEVVVSDADGTSSGGPLFTYLAPKGPTSNPPGPTPTTQTTVTGSSGIQGSISSSPGNPVLDTSGILKPVSGVVKVKLPGSSEWVLLSSLRNVPFGVIVDATQGKVTVTTVDRHGHEQSLTYYEGEFILTQRPNGLVVAILTGGDFTKCPTPQERVHPAHASARRVSRRHVVRKLWGDGHGSYSTKGNYATGAVLGTRWLTEDLCGGTLIRVVRDRVSVTNLVNHRHLTVKAGHSYLAKAP